MKDPSASTSGEPSTHVGFFKLQDWVDRLIAIRGIKESTMLNINTAAHIHLYGSEDHRMRELQTFICKWSRPVFDLKTDLKIELEDDTEPMDTDQKVAVKSELMDMTVTGKTCIPINCARINGNEQKLMAAIVEDPMDPPTNLIEFRSRLKEMDDEGVRVFLIRRAEEFRRFKNANFLRAFFDAVAKDSKRVVIITFSERPWSRIESQHFEFPVSQPIEFYVPKYTAAELKAELAKENRVSPSFVEHVLRALMGQTYCAGFDNWNCLLERVVAQCVDEGIPVTDDKFGYKGSGPRIAHITRELNLKDDGHFRMPQPFEGEEASTIHEPHPKAIHVNLPHIAKVLTLAAYCASYNLPTTDQRFFHKKRESKRRKNEHPSKAADRPKLHDHGPKSFDIHRLRLIFLYFWRTTEHPAQLSKDLQFQDLKREVTYLCSQGILVQANPTSQLKFDEPRYSCSASLAFAEKIAASLSVDLRAFLADFTDFK
ncbi:origin recognition complex subunit 5 [Aphelenchoides avenae]|nr:origin recognition complex subunit 5 [Aphelenchus avenae]